MLIFGMAGTVKYRTQKIRLNESYSAGHISKEEYDKQILELELKKLKEIRIMNKYNEYEKSNGNGFFHFCIL